MNMLRTAVPKICRRAFAHAPATTGPSPLEYGKGSGPKDPKDHPLFREHPVAPVVTLDDVPVPVLSFKEGYEKPQAAFNAMLAASVVVFSAITFYVWQNDILSLRLSSAPASYTKRKIGKGLGDID